MNIISWLKHLIKAEVFEAKREYGFCLEEWAKAVNKDNAPYKKLINYDAKILSIGEKIVAKENKDFAPKVLPPKVLILTSEIYDSGGHTELAIRYIQKNNSKEDLYFALTAFHNASETSAPTKSKELKSVLGSNFIEFDATREFDKKVIEIFNYIKSNGFSKIISNIHMSDTVGCTILGLIKKYSDIEISFWNHGDHFFALGTTFADEITTRVKNGSALTPYLKNNKHCTNGRFIIQYDKAKLLTKDEIREIRQKLNIPDGAFLTMTGCILSKVGRDYYQLIDKMLTRDKNIYHLFICPNYPEKKDKIEKLFKHNPRVIVIGATSEFDKYIQASDLYIDSFPQGSALTLIDYIKYKRPVVVKINTQHPIKSFEEYLYPNYEYAFKTPTAMLDGILKLANDKNEYTRVSEKCFDYFMNYYLKD